MESASFLFAAVSNVEKLLQRSSLSLSFFAPSDSAGNSDDDDDVRVFFRSHDESLHQRRLVTGDRLFLLLAWDGPSSVLVEDRVFCSSLLLKL